MISFPCVSFPCTGADALAQINEHPEALFLTRTSLGEADLAGLELVYVGPDYTISGRPGDGHVPAPGERLAWVVF